MDHGSPYRAALVKLPRPVATPTREAHLATLRAWHADKFGTADRSSAGPAPYGDTAGSRSVSRPDSAEREASLVVVARTDALIAVDLATGEVVPAAAVAPSEPA